MGTASSSAASSSSPEQQQQESIAAAAGSLQMLRVAFSKLSHSQTTIASNSLKEIFSFNTTNFVFRSGSAPNHFSELISNVGSAVVALLFPDPPDDSGITWIEFLKGYNRCCDRVPVSQAVNLIYRLYSILSKIVGIQCNLVFDGDLDDDKVGGDLLTSDLFVVLSMCWIMLRCSRGLKVEEGEKESVVIPDVRNLMLSVMVMCGVVVDDEGVWNCDVLEGNRSVSAQKLKDWVVKTAPGLANCFAKYVHDKLQAYTIVEDSSSLTSVSPLVANNHDDVGSDYLLTQGRAWAVSLTLRDRISEELLLASFRGVSSENLLYRSSIHGKGMNRFWSNIEGYIGPLMILVSAYSADGVAIDKGATEWVISMLTMEGLENRETFFGTSGYLYSMSPIFRALRPSGKEKNFVYCHLHPAIRVYEPNPKPVGLGFGGSIGNERIFLDEDFAYITIRHHAVDKTYEHVPLIPNQGFLPIQTPISEVEVWGFGGKAAKEQQDAYKRRELLFSEQRRKVDLKNFAWEDSPEKMMMDMMSDPNKVRREDR